MAETQPIKKSVLASYGQVALPLAIADLPLAIYLTAFYGSDIGVPLTELAFVLLIARLLDFLIDPTIGILSDKSVNIPVGRRKAWILMGIPLKMLGTYMVFFAEPGAGAGYLLLWIVVLYLGWTAIQIPYAALGAELSSDYFQRTRITGWRALFSFAGIFIATIAPLITGGGTGTPEGLTPVMQGMGLWALIMFPVTGALLALFVPEPPVRDHGKHDTSWLKGMKVAASNGAFMRILGATMLGRVGAVISTTVMPWFFLYAMGLGANSTLPIIVYLLAAVFGVPIWVKLGDKISKHRALVLAAISSIVCFGILVFIPKGALIPCCIVMLLAGFGGSASATLGQAITADVIDLDELRSRQQRAGLLLAFWAMGGKLSDALGGFVALMILAYIGFDAKSTTNSAEAVSGLTLVYVVMPWPFLMASTFLLWNFPLTAERHARIRSLVERRAARAANGGPGFAPIPNTTPIPMQELIPTPTPLTDAKLT